MGRMDGKVALVTGAARGMGRECAERLAAEGAAVVATDVIDPENGLDGVDFKKLDVSDEADWTRVVEDVLASHGRIDVLVNNAGIIAYEDIESVSLEAWNKVIAVNLTGTMLGMQKVIPVMKENGGGSIVNFSSIWGNAAVAGAAGYHASKGAVRNLTKNAAITYATEGIRANSVHLGSIDCELGAYIARITEDYDKSIMHVCSRNGDVIRTDDAVVVTRDGVRGNRNVNLTREEIKARSN